MIRTRELMALCVAILDMTIPPAMASTRPTVTAACAEQAHGAELYHTACAMCHGTQLEGNFQTPALTGRFVANWADAPVADLEAYIHRAMPLMAPGTLSPEDTRAVVAFLLETNGLPQGKIIRVGAGKRLSCPP